MGVFDNINLGKFARAVRGGRAEVVYFPGCTTQKYLPEIAENYKTILNDLGVPVRTVTPFCCGRPLKEQGYSEDFEKHKQKVQALIQSEGIKSLVTNCSSCLKTLRDEYGLEVRHTTEVIAEEKRKLQQFNHGEASFQDNCVTARELGMTQQARDIMVQTGFTLKEFSECKKKARCCGGSCGLSNNAGSVAVKLAQRRLRDAPTNTIVTDDPNCYIQLKRNTQNKEILELSETLVEI